MYIKKYKIAGITIQIEKKSPFKTSIQFEEFESDESCSYKILFSLINIIPKEFGKVVLDELGYRVYEKDNKFTYLYLDRKNDNYPYAYSKYDAKTHEKTVYYTEYGKDFFRESNQAFFHIQWESIMLNENRLLFHSCCVDTQFDGILFSGNSGIGKSTQGDLWVKYEDSKIINGDRPILYKDKEWRAYGSPYAGSSNVHINENCKIRCIVMLQQAKVNTIRKLNTFESFQKVFAQVTANTWDRESINKAMDLVEQLIKDIPVYELSCTPDQRAIELLKKTLMEDEENGTKKK